MDRRENEGAMIPKAVAQEMGRGFLARMNAMAAPQFEDVTLRLPVGLKEQVKEHAELKDRTLSENVAEALYFWINE